MDQYRAREEAGRGDKLSSSPRHPARSFTVAD